MRMRRWTPGSRSVGIDPKQGSCWDSGFVDPDSRSSERGSVANGGSTFSSTKSGFFCANMTRISKFTLSVLFCCVVGSEFTFSCAETARLRY